MSCITKKEWQIRHCMQRMHERLGEASTVKMLQFTKQIKSNRAIHIEKQSNRVTVKGVRDGKSWVVVVYDKLRGQIVTVLPKNSRFYDELEDKLLPKEILNA